MKKSFYVCKNLHQTAEFIKVNTDWNQISRVGFNNGDERIILINEFKRIRGHKVNKIYIDHSFEELRSEEKDMFLARFEHLNVEPIKIEEAGQ